MKVPKHVKVAFDYVCSYMKLAPEQIAECKVEFEQNPEWGMAFYPNAARIIRASQGQQTEQQQ